MRPLMPRAWPCLALLAALCPPPVSAEDEATAPAATPSVAGYEDVPAFGGPNSAGAQMRSDNERKDAAIKPEVTDTLLRPYYSFKGWLNERLGLAFGVDYATLYQYGAPTLGERNAASGVFRVYGDWTLVGGGTKDRGSIGFKVESRHGYSTVVPKALASQVGYAGLTAVTFSDAGWLLTNLYWHQAFLKNRIAFIAGFVDVTDYVNVYGLVNPWTDFSNYAFGNDPTIPWPNQGLGLALRGSLTDHLVVLAGLADANGDPGRPFQGFDTVVNQHQFFKHVAVGWRDPEQEVQSNVQITAWQSDAPSQLQVPSGWGLAVSGSYLFGENWLPFLRLGFGDGGAGAILDQSVSAGAGYYMRNMADLVGIGFNWGRPSEKTYGPALRSQLTFEAFYRAQLLQHLAVTPDVQLIVHPALQPGADAVVVLGIRARVVL